MRKFTVLLACGLGALLPFLYSCQKEELKSGTVPTISDLKISDINANSAKFEYEILSSGTSQITTSGICWSLYPYPSINTNTVIGNSTSGSFKNFMDNLTPNSTYYVRAYATNQEGIGYSKVQSFTTSYETMTDYEGNVYKIGKIGNHTWMLENLRVTKYRNGDPIPNVSYINDWIYLKSGAYCWYKNFESNRMNGAIYNWYAVNDSRKIAPVGWHIPTIEEFKVPPSGTGYSRLGAQDFYEDSSWWTSTGNDIGTATTYSFWADEEPFTAPKTAGLCVRCIKDE
jgi:hypothetical protein